ncbi:MAG: hypothetical protein KGL59_00335 [Acidobacteriota bacterium]|nr:hypothetical protein [Acidobacteriota bacterium]
MLTDTNGDGIANFLRGHVVVPASPSAAENAAAANLAARMGYGTSGLSLPVVESLPQTAEPSPKIFVGAGALDSGTAAAIAPLSSLLGPGEGGVFLANKNLAVIGSDAPGLLAVAINYAARAPYQWNTPGDTLQSIAEAIDKAFSEAKLKATAQLVGLTYVNQEPGIRRAILRVSGTAETEAVRKALTGAGKTVRFAAVKELVLLVGNAPPVTLVNSTPFATPSLSALKTPGPKPLDLGQLYSIKGLLGGSKEMPVPASVDARLYVPAGNAGIAMANLAARVGLETTGITLPLAYVPEGVAPSDVPEQAVVTADSPLGRQLVNELTAAKNDEGASFAKTVLQPLPEGEGELRAIDHAFGKHSAILVRGDAAGQAAALDYAAGHLPFLWQPDKRYESIDEMRYSLHRFFSLRSAAGQASAALFHLSRWLDAMKKSDAKPAAIEATVYVDHADPKLAGFIRNQIEQSEPGAKVTVQTGGLHAGLKCCEADPPLHYISRIHPFVEAKPTFSDDFTIPWEGRRLLNAVRKAAPGIERGQPTDLLAEVSEGPAERQKLTAELRSILLKAGADANHTHVEVLSAYKPGYSWLMDEIAPLIKGKAVSKIVIEFQPDIDPTHTSLLYSRARWLQELYPVDAMLARTLHIPLATIAFREMHDAGGPTYRVHVYSDNGSELLSRDFTVHTAVRPYSGEFPQYDQVQLDTGWVRLDSGGKSLLNQRVETDVEMFWDHDQTITLPRIFHFIMEQNDGKPVIEYQPLFDTLRLEIHMSEPDVSLGFDHGRISSLESLQEDTLYSTSNFFYMLGTLESTGIFDYFGRVIPVVYPSTDGQDGHIKIQFYAKDGPHPLVRLAWTDATGHERQERRDLPALQMEIPRLVAARVRAGASGVDTLTWEIPADADKQLYQDWIRREPASVVEHTMFSAEQGEGQVHWLAAMHVAGLYPDSLAYPDLRHLAMEFQLPRPLLAPEKSRPTFVTVDWPVPKPATPRPQITDYAPAPLPASASGHIVRWEEPISPKQSAEILARLAKFPGVTVYWMGRTYLGTNIWAADVLEPSPAKLRSVAKLETLKAVLMYSGRQHANEVSSTSHILRLAEELVRDPKMRAELKKVNVVIHPIDNPDGANLSIDLMHITPNYFLHPGYHGSLTADVQTALWDQDPIYPESRTRRLLWQSWLPDAFLNPHGYPSHEWVQPFSGYTAWMIRRMGVESTYSWWIPRGWFTSLSYLSDPKHQWSKDIAYELRDRIAKAINQVPGAAALDAGENSLYERYGVRWEPRRFQQPIHDGVRIYMSLKGQKAAPGGGGFMQRFPDVTWDEGYTEAPDETAHGAYLHLVAGMGLAYDKVHLDYLANGNLKIKREEKDYSNAVTWQISRERPILPDKWTIKAGPGVEDK